LEERGGEKMGGKERGREGRGGGETRREGKERWKEGKRNQMEMR
jgi:hypothetical protein